MREPDWADDRAREYNRQWWDENAVNIKLANDTLAALLREVVSHSEEECSYKLGSSQARQDTLVEAVRIVQEETSGDGRSMIFSEVRGRILSRLEKLP